MEAARLCLIYQTTHLPVAQVPHPQRLAKKILVKDVPINPHVLQALRSVQIQTNLKQN